MDAIIWIFPRVIIFKGKHRCLDGFFHADTYAVHRLVFDIYKNGKGRFNFKFINTSDKSDIANNTASILFNSVFLNSQFDGLFTISLFTCYCYCNPIHCSTAY